MWWYKFRHIIIVCLISSNFFRNFWIMWWLVSVWIMPYAKQKCLKTFHISLHFFYNRFFENKATEPTNRPLQPVKQCVNSIRFVLFARTRIQQNKSEQTERNWEWVDCPLLRHTDPFRQLYPFWNFRPVLVAVCKVWVFCILSVSFLQHLLEINQFSNRKLLR